jgi:hypothetical protein
MRTKWQRLVERAFPQFPSSGEGSSKSQPFSLPKPQRGGFNNSRGGRGGSRGGGSGSGAGPSGFKPSNSTSRVNPRPANAGPVAKDARGLETCHGYNGPKGCRRTAIDATTCRDPFSQVHYAHFCSNWDASAGAHCLKVHPRHGNH